MYANLNSLLKTLLCWFVSGLHVYTLGVILRLVFVCAQY